MQAQLLELQDQHNMRLSFLDGPFETAKASDPKVQSLGGVFHTWSDPPDRRHSREGLSGAVDHVLKYCEQEGPFDGVYGFSCGALVAALAAVVVESGTYAGAKPWRFLISTCGACLETGDMVNVPISMPSLHLVGAKDPMRTSSEALQKMFADVESFNMEYAGHCVPLQAFGDNKLQRAIRCFMSRVRNENMEQKG